MDQTTQPNDVETLTAKRLKIKEPFDTQILPNELWLEIFSHLSAHEVINSLAKVCNHFNLMTQDSKLIKKVLGKGCLISRLLNFLNLPLDKEGLNELNGKTILKFRRQKDCISIINTALQLCPNLMIIEIYWSSAKCPSNFSDDDMKHMIRYFYMMLIYLIDTNGQLIFDILFF